jgi:hypothetical protein
MKTIDDQGLGLLGDEKVAVDKAGTDERDGAVLTYTNYTGETGNSRHITRREYGIVPLAAVTKLRGMMNENPHDHYDAFPTGLRRWDDFLQDIATAGIRHPVFLNVDYGKAPMVNEGNHRIEAARLLGFAEVPVEIAYFGHAEDQGTVIDRYLSTL